MKYILTRNYLEETEAKYCLIKYGKSPETAKEIDDVILNDVKQVSIPDIYGKEYVYLSEFTNFGCGILFIGEKTDAYQHNLNKLEEIEYSSIGFKFKKDEALVSTNYAYEVLVATKDSIKIA